MSLPDRPAWGEIGLELAERAGEWSRESGTVSEPSLRPTFVPISEIREQAVRPLKSDAPWWWIFAPLILPLIEPPERSGSRSRALIVGLGIHRVQPGEESRREWAHFLPDDWYSVENQAFLRRLEAGASFNVPTNRGARESMLISTRLGEEFPDDPDSPDSSDFPSLKPILIDFAREGAEPPSVPGAKRLLVGRWKSLRDLVLADKDAPPSLDRALGEFPGLEGDESLEPWFQAYGKYLDARSSRLSKTKQVNETFFSGPLGALLDRAAQSGGEPRAKNKEAVLRRLLGFCVWLHDLAPASESVLAWDQLLTLHAWTPPAPDQEFAGVTYFTLSVYVRRNEWIAVDGATELAIQEEVGRFAAAFRSGGLVLTEERGKREGEARGKEQTESEIAHEVAQAWTSAGEAVRVLREGDSTGISAWLAEGSIEAVSVWLSISGAKVPAGCEIWYGDRGMDAKRWLEIIRKQAWKHFVCERAGTFDIVSEIVEGAPTENPVESLQEAPVVVQAGVSGGQYFVSWSQLEARHPELSAPQAAMYLYRFMLAAGRNALNHARPKAEVPTFWDETARFASGECPLQFRIDHSSHGTKVGVYNAMTSPLPDPLADRRGTSAVLNGIRKKLLGASAGEVVWGPMECDEVGQMFGAKMKYGWKAALFWPAPGLLVPSDGNVAI